MIRLIKPYLNYNEVENDFKKVFDSGIFTKGEYTRELTEKLKEYTGVKYAYLTTSATTALTMCLKILNIGKGDEVIVSDFSFPASVNVIEDIGATPIFCDVDLETFNMMPKELERKISKATKAVIFVDAFGNPSGLEMVKRICNVKEIILIEDAACAIGSSVNNLKVGNIADLTCFSFHPRKLLTTGEGGAILTNHEKYDEQLKVKLGHGASLSEGNMDFIDYGYNFRLPDLQCIMGIKQVEKLDDIIKQRNQIRDEYNKYLEPLGFILQKINHNVYFNVQSLVFKVPDHVKTLNLIKKLKENEIETTIGTYCLSNCKYYKEKYNQVQNNSKWLFENCITFPCYEGVDVKLICNTINMILNFK